MKYKQIILIMTELLLVLILIGEKTMPIVEPAELLGHITTEDGRRIPHYKVKTETTITNIDTGAEYESEAAAQADVDNPGTSTTEEKIRRDVKVFAPSLADMLGETPD
jgi:hypothetical protein